MLLARTGQKVLLLDRADFPSDMKASTHLLWHAGVASLERWGLLDKLRETGCPGMDKVTLDLGPMALTGSPPPAGAITEAFAPRRTVLDHLLVEAAVEAGASLQTGCTFTELLREHGRVCGVRFEDSDGKFHEERASLVVGADGRGSKVARAADAEIVAEQSSLGGVVWAYYSGLALDGIEFSSRPGRMSLAWGTNDDLCLVGMCLPSDEFQRVSKDTDGAMPVELETHAPGQIGRAHV